MLVARSQIDRPDADRALLEQALQNVARGAQRLLNFECGTSGRFQLFCDGHGTPNVQYTARAYQIFADIARVHDLDPAVLERIRKALFADRRADGHWDPSGYACGQESPFDLTAFTTWILARSGATDGDLAASRAWLDARAGSVSTDPYALGLYLLALGRSNPRPAAMASLAALVERGDFPLPRRTLMGGYDRTGRIEVEALAVLALVEHRVRSPLVADLVGRIESGRRATGIWGSTAATVLSLEALLVASEVDPEAGGDLAVLVGGIEVDRRAWTPRTRDLVALVDLKTHAAPGRRQVELLARGLAVAVQVVAVHHVPDDAPERPDPEPLELVLEPPPGPFRPGDPVDLVVRLANRADHPTSMLVLQVPVTPGLAFEEAVGPVRYRDEQPGRANLYLDVLPARGETLLRLRFTAICPGRTAWPRILAYDYYDPDRRAEACPGRVVVER